MQAPLPLPYPPPHYCLWRPRFLAVVVTLFSGRCIMDARSVGWCSWRYVVGCAENGP